MLNLNRWNPTCVKTLHSFGWTDPLNSACETNTATQVNWAALLSTSLSVHQDSCCCCSVAFSSGNLIQHVQHGGSESPGGVGAERFHVMRPEEANSVTRRRKETTPRPDREVRSLIDSSLLLMLTTGCSSIQTDLPTSCFCVNVLSCSDTEPHKTKVICLFGPNKHEWLSQTHENNRK